MNAHTRFVIAMTLVVIQAAIALALFQPAPAFTMTLAVLSSVTYSVFFWRRRQWARWVVIAVSVSSLLLVLPQIQQHKGAQRAGDIVRVPVAATLLLLLFSRPVKEQFHARPLF